MADRIDPEYFDKLAQIESSNNPNAKAKTSSAAGLYQFTKGTWNDLVKRLKLDYTEEDRYDPVKSREVVEQFTNDNKKYLETRLGRSVNDGELYLAHFLGRKGAKDMLTTLDTDENVSVVDAVSPQAINANASIFLNEDGTPKKIVDIFNWANNKMSIANNKSSIDSRAIEDSSLPAGDVETLIAENETNGLSQEVINSLNFSPPTAIDDITSNFTPNHAADNNFAFTGDIKAFNLGGHVKSGELDKTINEFNVGGDHQENPLGGIPLGINEQGGVNLVEEGETMYDGYIFSDALTISEEDIESSNLPEIYAGLTYSEASKKIKKAIEDRPFDKITKATSQKHLNQLIYSNEKNRVEKETSMGKIKKNKKFNEGGGIDYLGLLSSGIQAGTSLFGDTGVDTSGAQGRQQQASGLGAGLNGLASGASAGATFGPIGAGIGGLIGGAAGLFGSKRKNKDIQKANNNAGLAFNSQFHTGGPKHPHPHIQPPTGVNRLPGFPGNGEADAFISNTINPHITEHSARKSSTLSIGPALNPSSSFGFSNTRPKTLTQSPSAGFNNDLQRFLPKPSSPTLNSNLIGNLFDLKLPETTPLDVSGLNLPDLEFGDNAPEQAQAQAQDTGRTTPQTNRLDIESQPGTLEDTPQADLISKGFGALSRSGLTAEGINAAADGNDNKFKFDGNKLLRAAPTIGAALQLATAPDAEVESLSRLDNRFNPDFVDEASLTNRLKDSNANTRRALVANSGGSGSTARSNLLASQVNQVRSIGDAMFQAENINRNESTKEQQFNSRIDRVNLSQDNREKQINAQNRAASKENKQLLLNSLLGDLGAIGKEGQLNEILKKTLGFDFKGKFQKPETPETKESGGFLSGLFNQMDDPERKQIENIIREAHGNQQI